MNNTKPGEFELKLLTFASYGTQGDIDDTVSTSAEAVVKTLLLEKNKQSFDNLVEKLG